MLTNMLFLFSCQRVPKKNNPGPFPSCSQQKEVSGSLGYSTCLYVEHGSCSICLPVRLDDRIILHTRTTCNCAVMQNKPTFYMLRILQVVDVSDVLLIVVGLLLLSLTILSLKNNQSNVRSRLTSTATTSS